jgi:uncharacterized protein
MARRIVRLIAVGLFAAAAAGCSSAKPRFYTLDSTAVAGQTPAANISVAVGPVTVPASVDQPQFVVQVASNQVEVEEFNRWASPLNESIARAVAGDLSVMLGTANVTGAPLANFVPTYRVSIDVQRFESVRGQAAVVEAVWVVRKTGTSLMRTGRTVAREPVQGDGFDELAAAHSRALTKISADIAAAITAENETS